MLPLESSLELIQNYTKSFQERKDMALRNTNPTVVEAAAMIYNIINNMEDYGDIVEDPFKRKYTDSYDEMFQEDEEPMDVSVKNSGILNPNNGTVEKKMETTMGYWFHATRGLMNDGLKDMGFIPALYIGNSETDMDTESLTYTSQWFNKDKATIIIKLDNRFSMNQDGTPATVLMVECIDCTDKDKFMEKMVELCAKFKKLIISLRDLTPVESIQIYETMKENMVNIFKAYQQRVATKNKIMQ